MDEHLQLYYFYLKQIQRGGEKNSLELLDENIKKNGTKIIFIPSWDNELTPFTLFELIHINEDVVYENYIDRDIITNFNFDGLTEYFVGNTKNCVEFSTIHKLLGTYPDNIYFKHNENNPLDIDILVTHGPPWGHCDVTPYGNLNVGCELLMDRIIDVKPTLNIFGHIHEGYGVYTNEDTTFVNASICTADYRPTNKPIVIDLKEVDGKLKVTYVEE